ncbi:MAG: recombination protein RecR [Planctomycetota bacterium]|nr:MAG: recombination protein RecR [Planctomycetota bacterium]
MTEADSAPTGPLQRLIDELRRLPGIGQRSAERVAFHLLKAEREEALALSRAIADIKDKLRPCRRCYNLADGELCAICSDPRRDQRQIFVVEQPKDVISLENTGIVHGVYHVLMGHVAPVDGVGPDTLTIAALVERCRDGNVDEVVLATNPNLEGDATDLCVAEALKPTGVRITRLARGLAPGTHIEYANRSMLEEALRARRNVE